VKLAELESDRTLRFYLASIRKRVLNELPPGPALVHPVGDKEMSDMEDLVYSGDPFTATQAQLKIGKFMDKLSGSVLENKDAYRRALFQMSERIRNGAPLKTSEMKLLGFTDPPSTESALVRVALREQQNGENKELLAQLQVIRNRLGPLIDHLMLEDEAEIGTPIETFEQDLLKKPLRDRLGIIDRYINNSKTLGKSLRRALYKLSERVRNNNNSKRENSKVPQQQSESQFWALVEK